MHSHKLLKTSDPIPHAEAVDTIAKPIAATGPRTGVVVRRTVLTSDPIPRAEAVDTIAKPIAATDPRTGVVVRRTVLPEVTPTRC